MQGHVGHLGDHGGVRWVGPFGPYPPCHLPKGTAVGMGAPRELKSAATSVVPRFICSMSIASMSTAASPSRSYCLRLSASAAGFGAGFGLGFADGAAMRCWCGSGVAGEAFVSMAMPRQCPATDLCYGSDLCYRPLPIIVNAMRECCAFIVNHCPLQGMADLTRRRKLQRSP